MLTKRSPRPATETSAIYILSGEGTPFLSVNSVVRFSACPMSGSTTALELDGPAELLRRTSIHRIDGGGHQKVGAMEEEFEVLLTGTGKVVVRLSTKFPTSDYPEVTEHVIGVS